VDLHKDDANGGRGVVAPSDLVCHYFGKVHAAQ